MRAEKGGAPDRARPSFVSLNPCLDAILVETASPGQILALSHYSRDPASRSISATDAANMRFTGGTAEEIIALHPDIVLASSFIAPATRRALERAGLRVETFGSPVTVDESVAQVRRIARLGGREGKGDKLARAMRGAPLLADAAEDRPSAVLWQPGQIVPGERVLVSQLLRESGFASHGDPRGWEQADFVSLETMLADPPDLLLVAGDARGQNHPLLEELENVRVEPFAPNLLYCAGPTIPQVRARLAEIRRELERPEK